ncbi:MAG: hypothetical protein V4511_04255 [Bacteroidota bacterium]
MDITNQPIITTHTANEKLDAVLSVLNTANMDLIKAEGFAKLRFKDSLDSTEVLISLTNIDFKDIDSTELHLILPYLISENFIEKHESSPNGNNTITYKIRFNGKVFIENGGFTGKYSRETMESNRIRDLQLNAEKIQKSTLKVTYILAIASAIASIYYIIEVVKVLFFNN